MSDDVLKLFVRESNWIEGIKRHPRPEEIDAHLMVLDAATVDVAVMRQFVEMVQPDARLRDQVGLNVRVGNHIAPWGGPEIAERLRRLLRWAIEPQDAYKVHRLYQNLHPFTDGNGRSGRALWLRMMGGPEKVPLGFLHHWYYQSLSDGDRTLP